MCSNTNTHAYLLQTELGGCQEIMSEDSSSARRLQHVYPQVLSDPPPCVVSGLLSGTRPSCSRLRGVCLCAALRLLVHVPDVSLSVQRCVSWFICLMSPSCHHGSTRGSSQVARHHRLPLAQSHKTHTTTCRGNTTPPRTHTHSGRNCRRGDSGSVSVKARSRREAEGRTRTQLGAPACSNTRMEANITTTAPWKAPGCQPLGPEQRGMEMENG